MTIQEQAEAYITSQPAAKRHDMERIHKLILAMEPGCELWFLDGKNDAGKIVSNPNIGYGSRTIHYADGKTKPFYQVGLSANTSGISVYVMGIDDKNYLPDTYRKTIGNASVTGYCIKFKSLADIDIDVLKSAIADGFSNNKK